MNDLLTVLLLGVATGSAAFLITMSKFAEPFRSWCGRVSRWLHDLVRCPFCLSHYLSAIAIAIYRPRIVHQFWLTDYGVAWFVVIVVGTLVAGLIRRSLEHTPVPAPFPQRFVLIHDDAPSRRNSRTPV